MNSDQLSLRNTKKKKDMENDNKFKVYFFSNGTALLIFFSEPKMRRTDSYHIFGVGLQNKILEIFF